MSHYPEEGLLLTHVYLPPLHKIIPRTQSWQDFSNPDTSKAIGAFKNYAQNVRTGKWKPTGSPHGLEANGSHASCITTAFDDQNLALQGARFDCVAKKYLNIIPVQIDFNDKHIKFDDTKDHQQKMLGA